MPIAIATPSRGGVGLLALASVGAAAAVAEQVYRLGALPAGVVAAIPDMAELAGVAAGAQLICAGWPRRVGRAVHCARCGYEQDRRGPLVAVCPECGGPWRWLGWFRVGRLQIRPRAIVMGAALWALSAAAALVGA